MSVLIRPNFLQRRFETATTKGQIGGTATPLEWFKKVFFVVGTTCFHVRTAFDQGLPFPAQQNIQVDLPEGFIVTLEGAEAPLQF